jgi:hypothetical protein
MTDIEQDAIAQAQRMAPKRVSGPNQLEQLVEKRVQGIAEQLMTDHKRQLDHVQSMVSKSTAKLDKCIVYITKCARGGETPMSAQEFLNEINK